MSEYDKAREMAKGNMPMPAGYPCGAGSLYRAAQIELAHERDARLQAAGEYLPE